MHSSKQIHRLEEFQEDPIALSATTVDVIFMLPPPRSVTRLFNNLDGDPLFALVGLATNFHPLPSLAGTIAGITLERGGEGDVKAKQFALGA